MVTGQGNNSSECSRKGLTWFRWREEGCSGGKVSGPSCNRSQSDRSMWGWGPGRAEGKLSWILGCPPCPFTGWRQDPPGGWEGRAGELKLQWLNLAF